MANSELPTDEQIVQAGYDQMWAEGRDDLANNSTNIDPGPRDGDNRWGISIIAPIPAENAELFLSLRDTLRTWTGEAHTLYSAKNLHTTIRTCEPYRTSIAADDPAIAAYTQALSTVAAHTPPLTVRFRGLSANRTGIIVQGFPQSEQFQLLRQTLAQELAVLRHERGSETNRMRRGAHVSVAVFAGRLAAPQQLVDYIDAHRTTDFGALTLDNLRLVRYLRTKYDVTIIPLAQATLSG